MGCGKISGLLVSFAAFAFPLPGKAEVDETVQSLLERCAGDEALGTAYCIGFVRGISGAMLLNCMASQDGFVVPEKATADLTEATVGATIQAFVNWAEQHPEEWNAPQFFGVIYALSSTFPCE